MNGATLESRTVVWLSLPRCGQPYQPYTPAASAFGLLLVSYYASARIFRFQACGTQKAARAKPGL